MNILERFLKYISIDTTSNSLNDKNPTSKGQFELAKLLVKELNNINLDEIHYDDENCYIYGVLKGNENMPKIGFISHLDTSEDVSGNNIKPNIIDNYNGLDVNLENGIILSTKDYPNLKEHVGKTLITTDGSTLLGADDKAGIAEIMNMLEYFSNSNDEHGDIYVCFTPDEEIGLGTSNFKSKYFNPDFAYTVDGGGLGEFSYENFNAATANININGISTHCGTAKDKMINAGRVATLINSLLPEELPENTDGYQGFYHLDNLEGNVSNATMKYLIRDFDKDNFEKRKLILTTIIEQLNKKYNNCIEISIKDSYFNMMDVISKESYLIEGSKEAIKKIGVEPNIIPIRGGTDGTDISYMGIPCPNLGTGGHNFHSVYEYICLEDMEKSSEILVSIVNYFSKNKSKENIKNK